MSSVDLKKTLSGFAFSLIVSISAAADQRFYPSADHSPMAVGTEEFNENYASLAGLEGVQVITRYVVRSTRKHNITDMKTDLVKQIGERLNSAGLRMLDAKEVKITPGQPTLTFYPGYSGNSIDSKTPVTTASIESRDIADEKKNAPNPGSCRSTIWASFLQSATILRDPNKQFKFITWGTGDKTSVCEGRGAWTYNAVLKVVDKFITDYKKAESENESEAKLKTVNNPNEVPENCTQAWTINRKVFEVNQTRIIDEIKPILDKLAETASRCENYRYVIKTQSDHLIDAKYNRILSEARAHAIKDYLLLKNISHQRLETVALGVSNSLNDGTSKKNHVESSRVVITPQLH